MKKLTWLSLVLVLAMVLGAISFAFAGDNTAALTAWEDANKGPHPMGDPNGDIARGYAKILLGDRYSDAIFDLYASGYYAGSRTASYGWYVSDASSSK